MHTPELWRLGRPGAVVADSAEGITINGACDAAAREYYGGNLICESVSEANARRIAACVNFCAGVDTEQLERWHAAGVSLGMPVAGGTVAGRAEVFKAHPTYKGHVVPDLEIVARETAPADTVPENVAGNDLLREWRRIYRSQADRMLDAMMVALPGGTIDQLLVALMERKASVLRVTHERNDSE